MLNYKFSIDFFETMFIFAVENRNILSIYMLFSGKNTYYFRNKQEKNINFYIFRIKIPTKYTLMIGFQDNIQDNEPCCRARLCGGRVFMP